MNAKSVATTIISQLGGNRFVAMTGAKNFMALNDKLGGVQFDIPGTLTGGWNRVRVVLDFSDTYDVKFYKIRKVKGIPTVKAEKDFSNIYNDSIESLFSQETGLATRF